MAVDFEPRLSILPVQQRRLWSELGGVPSSFVLCGGTAIALQLGHRASIDFDFITSEEFDPDELYSAVSFLQNSQPIQKAPNTLTCIVDRGGSVHVSFFGTPGVRLTTVPLVAKDNRLRVASLIESAPPVELVV